MRNLIAATLALGRRNPGGVEAMKAQGKIPALLLAAMSAGLAGAFGAEELRRVTGREGEVAAVTVPESAMILHVTQLFPEASGDESAQTTSLVTSLKSVLASAGSDLQHLVRVHLYGRSPEAIAALHQAIRDATRGHEPALSAVQTPLPDARTSVALDAVAVRAGSPPAGGPPGDPSTVRVLAPGARVFISGQAEKGDGTLADATRKTLESLERTLGFLGMEKGDAVHVKCFVKPMSDAAVVRETMQAFFAPMPSPPLALVEWESSLPIEIELVAGRGGKPDAGPAVEYLTPPGMTASPVYCRVARVNRGPLIFTGGITAAASALESPEAELKDTFAQLRELLDKTSSDFRHLVKATYYVSDAEANKRHNELRPEYYDPQRPPAASKATVRSIGIPGRRYTMDMIAAGK